MDVVWSVALSNADTAYKCTVGDMSAFLLFAGHRCSVIQNLTTRRPITRLRKIDDSQSHAVGLGYSITYEVCSSSFRNMLGVLQAIIKVYPTAIFGTYYVATCPKILPKAGEEQGYLAVRSPSS